MKRLGLFIDVRNIFHNLNKKYHLKLDYQKYLDIFKEENVLRSVAVNINVDQAPLEFIWTLRSLGFVTVFEDTRFNDKVKQDEECNVNLICEIVKVMDRLDVIVIGSQNKTLIPFISFLKNRGLEVIVCATAIPKDLRFASDKWIEVTDEHTQ